MRFRGGCTPIGVGSVHKKPHRGIEPQCGCLTLLVEAVEVAVEAAALGVFRWLQVMDLDLFFGFLSFFVLFVLHVFRFLLLGCLLFLLCQWHRTSIDARL